MHSEYRPIILWLLMLAACGGEDRSNLATPVIDTLPNGAYSVSNAGPSRWVDPNEVVFSETLRIGEDAESGSEAELINPQSVGYDGAGRIYVADSKPAVIKVYDRDGAFVRTIGKEGRGPGEFLVAFIAVSGPYLFVHDPQVARTSVFDTTGTYRDSWVSSCCYWSSISLDERGNAVIPSAAWDLPGVELERLYVVFNRLGELVDSLKIPDLDLPEPPSWNFQDDQGRMRMSTSIPLQPSVQITPTAAGILLGWSGEYRLVLSETGRDTVMVFGRDWVPTAIDDSYRERILARAKERTFSNLDEDSKDDVMKLVDIPSTAPAFVSMARDGAGRFWVQVEPGSDTVGTAFDVFDGNGIYLGPAGGPATLERMFRTVWGDGVVYAWGENEDGLPVVYRYAVRMPEET